MINFSNVTFVKSCPTRKEKPQVKKSEVLIVGKSNVGKSSLINALCNKKKMAFTSSKPGHTRLLNYYDIDNRFYMVDAPGYGYATLSKKNQKKFGLMMEDYLTTRENLKQVFMLVDFRHKLSRDDIMMFNYLKHYQIPVTIVATKIDKVGVTQHQKLNYTSIKIKQ